MKMSIVVSFTKRILLSQIIDESLLFFQVIAAFKKETDISIGNLVGSNIFNLLAVMGITSLVKPLAVDPLLLTQDIWWMLGISALLLPLMFIGGKVINRFKGLIFLAIYITYIVVVLL